MIEFDTATGQSVFVEVDSIDDSELRRMSGVSELPQKATKTFEATLEAMYPVIIALRRWVESTTTDADEVSIEFGARFSANAGVIIASATAEANFKISVRWKLGS